MTKISFEGVVSLPATNYLYKQFSGRLKDMQQEMATVYPALMEHIANSGTLPLGEGLAAYHEADDQQDRFVVDIALPVADPESLADDVAFSARSISGGKHLKVILFGAYRFLALAWSSAMSYPALEQQKIDFSRPSLEVYENSPRLVSDSNELQTALYVPIK